MQTSLTEPFKNSDAGQEAERILRACVHCGFCTATCPTYQLLGDELDGPRGRIYLIKQVLEGHQVTAKTQGHLDRCLTCHACESTCPSGVQYGRLVEIGRHVVEQRVGRPWREQFIHGALRAIVPYTARFGALLSLGRALKPLLPKSLAQKIPARQHSKPWPEQSHRRKMLVLDGCVQPVTAPNTNAAAARVLDRLNIQLIRATGAGCCGAINQHLLARDPALDDMRRNIDAWWPHIDAGAEAIVITASGCGVIVIVIVIVIVKDYGELLKHNAVYAEKAKHVADLTRDISEILAAEDLSALQNETRGIKVAFHAPCTLQHGQQINHLVEKILRDAGYILTPVADSHLCCGSAGTYSILQPRLSGQLLDNKLQSLSAGTPDYIATANIGCQLHMATKANVPVKGWKSYWTDNRHHRATGRATASFKSGDRNNLPSHAPSTNGTDLKSIFLFIN